MVPVAAVLEAEVSAEAAFPAEVLAEAEAAAGNFKKMQRNVAKDCSVPFSYIKFIFVSIFCGEKLKGTGNIEYGVLYKNF